MKSFKLIILISLTISSVAFAHSGVKDKNVKERMIVMKEMAGNTKIIGWFVGQVMKESQGKANPQAVNELLKTKLAT